MRYISYNLKTRYGSSPLAGFFINPLTPISQLSRPMPLRHHLPRLRLVLPPRATTPGYVAAAGRRIFLSCYISVSTSVCTPWGFPPNRSNESFERRAAPFKYEMIYTWAKFAAVICIDVVWCLCPHGGSLQIVPAPLRDEFIYTWAKLTTVIYVVWYCVYTAARKINDTAIEINIY